MQTLRDVLSIHPAGLHLHMKATNKTSWRKRFCAPQDKLWYCTSWFFDIDGQRWFQVKNPGKGQLSENSNHQVEIDSPGIFRVAASAPAGGNTKMEKTGGILIFDIFIDSIFKDIDDGINKLIPSSSWHQLKDETDGQRSHPSWAAYRSLPSSSWCSKLDPYLILHQIEDARHSHHWSMLCKISSILLSANSPCWNVQD